MQVIGRMLDKGAEVNIKDADGITPLHLAARENHRNVLELLLAKGACVNAKDKFGLTPLHLAAEQGNAAEVTLLIEQGADRNAKAEGGEYKGCTPLAIAEKKKKGEIVTLLKNTKP